MTEIPERVRRNHYAFLVNAPENFSHSNGISVLLSAAQLARSLGLEAVVVPCHTSTPLYHNLPEPYSDLPIRWQVPSGCCALAGDTLTDDRLQETRAGAAHLCHYTMAPLGLFGGEGTFGNRVSLKPGERQAVYSPQISTQLPSFYLQSQFADLEPWMNLAKKKRAAQASRYKSRRLRACIYAGKGYLQPLPPELRQRINRSSSRLITRLQPANKTTLYQHLFETDLLISFDPLSSLAYEATLMGIPAFISAGWDESEFKQQFPVRLDGMVWHDWAEVLELLQHGFDHNAVVASYQAALAHKPQTLVSLLDFATGGDPQLSLSVDQLNQYWRSRQPFFNSLKLPSPPSAWGPIEAALTDHTGLEHLRANVQTGRQRCASLMRRMAGRCRSLPRRIGKFLRRGAD